MSFFRPIHHVFAPLADREQVWLAFKILWQPWTWKRGPAHDALERELAKRFGGEAVLFGSGREALLAILQSLKLKKDEEVIVQAYTCIVVPNAVLAANMVPVYVDIERDTLNIDIDQVEAAITSKTRAIICQHTFGIPAFTKRLREICDRHSLFLIEDCAQMLPDKNEPRSIGLHGDVMFCSFGRDKAVSGVTGGAVVCRNKDICGELKRLQQDAQSLSLMRIKHLLHYPILYWIARPLYALWIGKAFLALAGRLRLLVPIVTSAEKHGSMRTTLHRMPDSCARLALQQLHKLEAINAHRRNLTKYFFNESTKRGWPMLLGVTPDLPLQKFPLFVNGAEGIRQRLKKHNVHLHDGWTGCVICPANADGECVGYKDGDDPAADLAGEQILSLPTHPTMTIKQAEELVVLLAPLLP